MSFDLVQMGEVAKFINGDRGKNYPSKDSFVESGIAFINAGCLSDLNILDKSKLNYITEENYNRLSSGKIQKNDILFCLRGSLGKFAVIRDNELGALASSLVIIRANEKVDVEYLKHFLSSDLCAKEISAYENGAAQPNLSASDLKKFQIPLPPLTEQKRIAQILDKADELRQKRQQSIAKLDELLQATFIDMFGDPVTNPKGWEIKNLSEVSVFENGDRSSNYPSGNDLVSEGIPFLSTKNIRNNNYNETELNFITQEKFNSLTRGKVKNGDILITLRGTLGSNCIYKSKFDTAFINAQMMIIKPKSINNIYLHRLLSFKSLQDKFQRLGQGAAVPQLTAKQLSNLEIIYSPMDLQDNFAKVAQKIEQQKQTLLKQLERQENLFQSLQQRAFNGEL